MIRYVAKCKALKDIEGEQKLNGMLIKSVWGSWYARQMD